MQVQYVDDKTPRSDNRSGKPVGITLFDTYEVFDTQDDKYVLLNDEGKLSRYSKHRFIVADDSKIPELDHVRINELTRPLRMEIKRLRKLISE